MPREENTRVQHWPLPTNTHRSVRWKNGEFRGVPRQLPGLMVQFPGSSQHWQKERSLAINLWSFRNDLNQQCILKVLEMVATCGVHRQRSHF